MKATEIKTEITIGGSEIAAALGLSPFKTPHQLWREKKLGEVEEPSPEQKARFRAGLLAEEYILRLAEIQPDKTQEVITIGSARGSIDARIGSRIFELKTSYSLWDEVPTHYQLQIQWYMGLYHLQTGEMPSGELIAMDGMFNLRRYELQFNRELFDSLDEKIGQWIEKYIIGDAVPPMNAEELASIMPKEEIRQDDSIADAVATARELKAKIKALEAELKPLEEQIKLVIGDAEAIICNGEKITWKGYERASLDTKALQAEMPDVYAKYLKKSNYRILKF